MGSKQAIFSLLNTWKSTNCGDGL